MYVTAATLGNRTPTGLDSTYFGESARVATL
jgi:hypothetical protein